MEFVLKRACPEDPQKEQVLMAALGCSRPMARALLQRGQDTPQKAAAFLEPSRIPLPDPYGLQDMDRAAALIREAVEQGRSIWVYGDYDADGVCATAILTRGLLGLGANVHWYIPSRHKEGYGMNKGAVRALKEQGAELIVTVDNGIAAFEEIALARALGMEVVVTDHHRIQGDLPACGAVVCVSREEYRERVNDLCGAGVAYLLVKALWQQEPLELLPLAAVATAADIVDVTRENRGILYKGMSMVKGQTGFAALLRSAGAYQQPVTETTLGYVIAPRLNAAGRMGEADTALKLLLTEDEGEAAALALELERMNVQRKTEEQRIYEACRNMLPEWEEKPVLLLCGEDWNPGVVGIVASRMVERTHKPAILLTRSKEGYTGSGRSVEGVDLFALLTCCRECFVRYGGHAGAAGMTLTEDALPVFQTRLEEAFCRLFPQGAPLPSLAYEDVLRPEACTAALARELEGLAPFGPGNEEPVFRLPEVPLGSVAFLGREQKHLSARLGTGERGLRLVAFGQGECYAQWRSISRADVLARVQLNRYNGYESCQLQCQWLRRAGTWHKDEKIPKIVDDFFAGLRYNIMSQSFPVAERIAGWLGPLPVSEARLRDLYRLLYRGYAQTEAPLLTLGTLEEKAAALIFLELGFFTLGEEGLCPVKGCPRRDCKESMLYRAFCAGQSGKEQVQEA